ncbi:glycoside hydrolase family 2 protein [Ktedonobacter racemifer]|uniref:Glycoside hydrolase family 2 sugar binding n=1 Tax=Ktedonobacter racemifer DSM 44963 TaxID=485913 RepID=D6TZY4_KTERA|nr:sugar-binding domain-containing protein [Ktedonobacter racemifer]EFH82124.1 glycoside hydrolase family 2 sugar binding [Ktedonobacter racemifer DSM 44963]
MSIPRPEYPRPQFVRSEWLNLNGEWQFEIDAGDSGLERGLVQRELQDRILVPFCPESELSGIGNTDFMPAVWYRRTVTIPSSWGEQRVLLHFQAVDYDTTVWVNGTEVARHRGGFTPFSCEIPSGLAGSDVTIVVRARDTAQPPQPRGKQSQRYENHSCLYTRTTGIWQTVWLEPVPTVSLKRPRITPDVAHGCFNLTQPLSALGTGLTLRVRLKDDAGEICTVSVPADRDFSPKVTLPIPEERRHYWSTQSPYLYDLEIELLNGETAVDSATSYAGLRSVTIDGKAVKINGQTVFQRLVLDQGYYPDGIMTAPSDEALVHDIKLGLQAGFNGARLHQKVFEERFLYHADRLGYLVWGEFPDWGCGGYGREDDHQQPGATYVTQWLEAIERDYSHPSIVGWCPLNETWQVLTDRTTVLDDVTRAMFLATKAMDSTRPVLDTSGYSHRVPETDIYDSHDYEQDPVKFAANHAGTGENKPFINRHREQVISVPYRNQPYFVSEFGGIWWNPEVEPGKDSWGYGAAPRSLDEFYDRFKGLCDVLLDDAAMFGYCYTQLTDVYQEQNGIYTFDRKEKFDIERIRDVQTRIAAIEKI